MQVYIATVHSIHNGIEEFNIIAVSLDYDKAKNAMNTDYLDTIHNMYDERGINYSTNQQDDVYTIQENGLIYEHFDEFVLKVAELI